MDRDTLIANLFETMHALKRGMHASMQHINDKLPVSHAQLELLFTIKHLQPVTSKKLAAQMHLTPGAISQLLDGLTEQSLIERHIDPSDRRIQSLKISKQGIIVLKSIEEHRQSIMENVMRDLTNEELITWTRIQQKLIQELQSNNKTTEKEGI